MVKKKISIAIAVKNSLEASRLEILLNDDGYDVSIFKSAEELGNSFEIHRSRFVVVDRRFEGGFSGLDLSRMIREKYMLPFVYILMLSHLNSIEEIEEGLDAGVNDYLIKPHNLFQIRSRVRVGLRWLQYIDSVLGGS